MSNHIKIKTLLLLGALGSLNACAYYSGPRYVPRPDIAPQNYTRENAMEDRSDRRAYNEYEHREQCQHYRRIPRNSVELSNCMVVKAPRHGETMVTETHRHIVHTYTLYFDFDKSNIRRDQQAVLDQIAREIQTYDPAEVTVTGFTDRAGSMKYNEKLSAKRAHAVSRALTALGVQNQELAQQARGEEDNAVPTKDGVRLRENRRVVVDFRR